ncbi:MAG: transposase [Pseudomonadota bacterium]
MKVETILYNLITDVTPNMHNVRRASLNAMVTSLVSGADLDPRKQHFLLRASTAVDGRSLTLLEEIHPLSSKEKPKTHRLFMGKLRAILASSCKPIIVTDAGFRISWFKLIELLNWDYVGRVRNQTHCKNKRDKDWHPVKDLYTKANALIYRSRVPDCKDKQECCPNSPLKNDDGWFLEIVDIDNNSTIWDEPFDSDQLAFDEAMNAIEEEGILAFIDPDSK